MTELKLISVDTSKHVFTLHGVGDRGEVVLRRELRRQQLEGFFARCPRRMWFWRHVAARITGAAF